MPEINPSLPRPTYKFMGQTVTIPHAWSEGDTLDANSAKFINRSLASVVGNLLGQRIRAEVESLAKADAEKPEADRRKNPDGTPYAFSSADLPAGWAQTKADEVFTGYTPGVTNTRTGSGGSAHDPVQSIAEGIAWEKIKPRLAAINVPINKVKAEKRRELIDQYLTKFPAILEQAKAIFGAATEDDDLNLDGLDAGSDTTSGTDTTVGSDTRPGDDSISDTDGNDTIGGTDSEPGTDSVPDSEPSSTAETDGATAADAGASPANPGTVGTTDEGTGQGTPGKGNAKGGTKDSGEGLPDTAKPSNPPAAFS